MSIESKKVKYTTGRNSASRVNVSENVRRAIHVPSGYTLVKKDPIWCRIHDEFCLDNCSSLRTMFAGKVGV